MVCGATSRGEDFPAIDVGGHFRVFAKSLYHRHLHHNRRNRRRLRAYPHALLCPVVPGRLGSFVRFAARSYGVGYNIARRPWWQARVSVGLQFLLTPRRGARIIPYSLHLLGQRHKDVYHDSGILVLRFAACSPDARGHGG